MGEIANRDNKKMLILFAEVVAALATILIAVLAMKIPVVPVCVIVLIEVAIAACLQEVPVWVHAVVAAVQLVAWQSAAEWVFCLLCILIYVFAIIDTAGSKSVMIRPLTKRMLGKGLLSVKGEKDVRKTF